MALAHRINVNICPLLNTFYCKCVTKTTRFVSQLPGSKMGSAVFPGNQTFSEMIAYRRDQAHRSIIVKVQSFNIAPKLYHFCSSYGRILNAFPYTTLDNQRFILIEFAQSDNIQELRNCTNKSTSNAETVCTVSPLFIYTRAAGSDYNNTYLSNEVATYPKCFLTTPSKITNKLKPLKTVSEQMVCLYDVLKISELDVRLRFYTAEQLTYYLSRLFMNLYVVPFGSSVNGFGQKGCDLDLVCRSFNLSKPGQKPKSFHFLTQTVTFSDKLKQREFLETVSVLMKTCIPGIRSIRSILEARVPIIKFTNYNTNVQCDLSSTNTIALCMSEMLYTYGELDSRVRPLVCTVRKWAKVQQITRDNPGHWITNFSLTLLVIFYLQIKNILPPLNNLFSYTSKEVKHVDTSWTKKFSSSNDESLDKLLYGFFKYYSEFDFKVQAICVREGKIKEKKENSPIYIYNPFERSLNVSKNINQLELVRLLHQFQSALYTFITTDESEIILSLLNYVTNNSPSNVDRNIVLKEQSELLNEELLSTNNSEKMKEIIK
nr:poly(A) RNA polymerase, mitochondrial [Osmia lignaria]